jgi:hypothetical protein
MNTKIVLQFLFFSLSFYCFGAGVIDSFVVYHGWTFVGTNDFALVHQEMSKRIVGLYVSATLLMTIMTIVMLWKRPLNIPKSWVIGALVCEAVSWISSALIQIPIQGKLSQGLDEAALERLIATDWIRVAAWVLFIIIVSRMLFRILAANEKLTHSK